MKAIRKGLVPVLVASVLAMPAFAQETVLRVSSWLPPSHAIVRDMIMPWAEDVTAATEGRVKIQLLDAPLGPPPAHMDLALTGAADITFGVHDYTPGRFALHKIVQGPFLADTATAASVAYWRVYEQYLAAANEHKGVQLLGLFTHGPGLLYLRDRTPSPIANLKGAKVRIAGPMTSEMSAALGMVPVQAPAPQSYELLSGGIVDGTYFPAESVTFFKIADELSDALRVPGGLFNASFFLVMNQRSFDKLSEADQAAIMALSGEAFARRAGNAWDAVDTAGYDAMEGLVTITDANEADLAAITEAAAPLVDTIRAEYAAKGVDYDATVESLQAEISALAAK